MTERTKKSGLICPKCGYALQSLTSNRCPECGHTFEIKSPAKTGKQHPLWNVGAFFGNLARELKSDSSKSKDRTEVRRTVEEEDRGDMILRRTTIDEVEFKQQQRKSGCDQESDSKE